MAVEAGVPGLILWVALVASNVIIPLRLRRRMPKTWSKGTPDQRFFSAATLYLPLATVGFGVTASFVSFAWMEPLYMLSALVAGLSLVARRQGLVPSLAGRGAAFRSLRARPAATVPHPSPTPRSRP